MQNFDNIQMRYEPYPLGVVRPAIDPGTYRELVANFPDISLFGTLSNHPYKLSLSEKWASDNYSRFIRENGPWRKFHAWVKSDDFIRTVLGALKAQGVELPVDESLEPLSDSLKRHAKSVLKGRLPRVAPKLRTRFEFSVLKADGGEVAPHTDTARKIVTLVVSMCDDGEWPEGYGGGLDINRTTNPRFAYNWKNRLVPWEDTEVVETIPFVPNQCIVFVKTFNSLHSVRRMTQTGSDALRRTITIVIEQEK